MEYDSNIVDHDLPSKSTANGVEYLDEPKGVVGAERVLAVLVTLAQAPDGLALEEIASRTRLPKSTVHRALASLRRAGFASQPGGGRYLLGDEYLRLAFSYQERRASASRLEPVLRELSTLFDETAHYAILDGDDVVYQAKHDPATGAIRLSSVVGGRNPAHATAVGKLLLAYRYPDLASVREWSAGRTLPAKTARTLTDANQLATAFRAIREQGFATDDEEGEVGVNCIALPIFLDTSSVPTGAVSVSGLTFRTPLTTLVGQVDTVRKLIRSHDLRTSES